LVLVVFGFDSGLIAQRVGALAQEEGVRSRGLRRLAQPPHAAQPVGNRLVRQRLSFRNHRQIRHDPAKK